MIKRRNLLKSLAFLLFVKKRSKSEYRRSIGLQDRNYKTIHENDKLKVMTTGGEKTGIVKWGKYVAGYTLQEGLSSKENNDKTIATFRFHVIGPSKILEMPDGRIDGIIV
jgi:hypothetical protein